MGGGGGGSKVVGHLEIYLFLYTYFRPFQTLECLKCCNPGVGDFYLQKLKCGICNNIPIISVRIKNFQRIFRSRAKEENLTLKQPRIVHDACINPKYNVL